MAYDQYSEFGYTGNEEGAKNRIPNNAYDASLAEYVTFPNKFDLFVNKDNATFGAYSVTEDHKTSNLSGSVLYLDHRPESGTTITVSDGTLDLSSLDIATASISFSSLPVGDTFTVSYSAVGDKIWDSHINALQNAVMKIETTIGLANPVNGIGTGIMSLPIVTQFSPSTDTELTSIQTNVLPQIVPAGDLLADFKLGSTSNPSLSIYGTSHNIVLGNTGAGARDDIYVDASNLAVNENNPGTLTYSAHTGDLVFFSGASTFASQMTIGQSHAGTGVYDGTVIPAHQSFYDDAMLRVHGGIFFGNSMTGNGSITFNSTTGSALDVIGSATVDTLTVDQTSIFYGESTFKDRLHVQSPGYFETNQDIILTDKANNTPTTIDGLDPSYAASALKNLGSYNDVVSTPVYDRSFATEHRNPYISGQKEHPIHGFTMYPMLGGWTFTGSVSYDIATENSHKLVVLAGADLRFVSGGNGATGDGSYCPGLFTPGDTVLEINNGGGDSYQYPIYWHEAFLDGSDIATGINFYLAGDDASLQNPGIAGAAYRILQPTNAPMDFLVSSYASASDPRVTFGMPSSSYYAGGAQNSIFLKTSSAQKGPSISTYPHPLYKELANNTELDCSVLEALRRNIDHEGIVADGGYGGITTPIKGVAYIYAAALPSNSTISTQFVLKASPSPYGLIGSNLWNNGANYNPGQWTLIGEHVASTSDGVSWTEVETVGYRANGLYDSCWVPIVNYRETGFRSDLERCLPLYGADDSLSTTEFDSDEGAVNFFVEHNLGPVNSLRDISVRVLCGSLIHDLTAKPNGEWTSKHQSSATFGTPYGNAAVPYGSNHDFYDATFVTGLRGHFRDITGLVRVAMIDSRFLRLKMDSIGGSSGLAAGLAHPNGDTSQYIRVVIERTH